MSIWVLSDLHLAFSVPEKTMEDFGPAWHNYAEKIADNWKKLVSPNDLVLIPGDVCWAKHLEEALIDLKWIDALPGTKLLLRGQPRLLVGFFGQDDQSHAPFNPFYSQ